MRKRDTCLRCGHRRASHNESRGCTVWPNLYPCQCSRFISNTPANRAKAEKPVDKKPVKGDTSLFPLLGLPQWQIPSRPSRSPWKPG